MNKDLFSHKARSYDTNTKRVENVDNIATAIISQIALPATGEIMDFGSGTGLLLERIAPHVRKITAVDISPSMNQQLLAKANAIACELESLQLDLTTEPLERRFAGIVSSMTMHHIADIPAMFARFRSLLLPDGFLAIADLETEDGSFHDEDTGVFHKGFDPAAFASIAEEAGFRNVACRRVGVVEKPGGQYPVFLLTAVHRAQ